MRRLAYAVAALFIASPAPAAVRKVTLQPPARDFGYFLGDVLTAVAVIDVDPGTVLDRSALPEPGPVSRQIDIRRVLVTESSDGQGGVVRVQIDYQSFFGPDAATQTEVPGYRLEFADGHQHFSADVPSWRFMASALRHAVVAVTDAKGMRPDHAPMQVRNGTAALRLGGGLAVALAAGCLLLVRRWLVPAVGAHRLPFTSAARRLPALLRAAVPTGGQGAALLALHRAFDATAGYAVLAGDTDRFVAVHPRFAEQRADIACFFLRSQEQFFKSEASLAPITDQWLLAFARRLARAERG